MAFIYDQHFEHLLRRAGFGARPDELDAYRRMAFNEAVDSLVNYERIPDDVDTKIGQPGYVQVAAPGRVFSPNTVITDAQQRWLFRMVHTNRPLQEKMTLFWHNHFATAYTKVAGSLGADRSDALHGGEAGRGSRRRARPDRDAARERARQLPRPPRRDRQGHRDADLARRPDQRAREAAGELRPRDHGAVHDGRRPLHRGRRLRGGARVHRLEPDAAWRRPTAAALRRSSSTPRSTTRPRRPSRFRSTRTAATTIPARGAGNGMQDGLDFIAALAAQPAHRRAISPASCTASSCPSSATSTRSSSTACRRPTFRAATT